MSTAWLNKKRQLHWGGGVATSGWGAYTPQDHTLIISSVNFPDQKKVTGFQTSSNRRGDPCIANFFSTPPCSPLLATFFLKKRSPKSQIFFTIPPPQTSFGRRYGGPWRVYTPISPTPMSDVLNSIQNQIRMPKHIPYGKKTVPFLFCLYLVNLNQIARNFN